MKNKHLLILLSLLAVAPVFAQNGEFLIDTNVVYNPDANMQSHSAISYDGTNYFVVWQDDRSDTGDIFALRVSSTGMILDSLAIMISGATGLQSLPSITHGFNKYFSVWVSEENNIYGARIEPAGIVIDTSAIQISLTFGNSHPAVSTDSTNYFVVWDWSYGCIYGARVDQSGVVLDIPSILIQGCDNNLYAWAPAHKFNGVNHFVVYDHNAEHTNEIVGKRVNQNGVVIDSTWIDAVPGVSYYQFSSAIDYYDSNYLVVFEYKPTWNSDKNIFGARVTSNGMAIDSMGFAICVDPDSQTNPCIAFNGTDYVVAWEDWRNGSESDIYGARVSTSGTVLDSFIVSDAPGNQLSPAITRGPGNQVLITYSGWTDSINGQPVNTMRIWGRFYPDLAVAEHDDIALQGIQLSIAPNPFRNETRIAYSVGRIAQELSINIYDISGRVVKSFRLTPDAFRTAQIAWTGRDDQNRVLPSGVYFVQLTAGEYTETQKVLLIK